MFFLISLLYRVIETTDLLFYICYKLYSGNYMYIETSSPQTSGMLARLMSPLYPAPTTGHCLIFYYNMYGENIDTLSVMQRQEVFFTVCKT